MQLVFLYEDNAKLKFLLCSKFFIRFSSDSKLSRNNVKVFLSSIHISSEKLNFGKKGIEELYYELILMYFYGFAVELQGWSQLIFINQIYW